MSMHYEAPVLHDVSVDDAKTEACQIPAWAKRAAVFVPALGTNCAVSMEVLRNQVVTAALLLASNDTSWYAAYDEAESNQVAASGVEDCWVDITTYIRGLPADAWIRFVMASSQAGDTQFYVSFRD